MIKKYSVLFLTKDAIEGFLHFHRIMKKYILRLQLLIDLLLCSGAGTYLKVLRTKVYYRCTLISLAEDKTSSVFKVYGDISQKWYILKTLSQNMVGTYPYVPICSGAPAMTLNGNRKLTDKV